MHPHADLRDLALALAAKANECCNRSDGWEAYLAEEFEQLLKEALLTDRGQHGL